MVKYILKYANKKNFLVYTDEITYGKKREIIWWCGIFTDRMTDGIILSVIPSMIFNLWPVIFNIFIL
jgi:hypothetical protein